MGTTVAATSLAKDYDLPWVEKYRPHKVADIVGNQDVVARLQVIAQGGNMPNLIFSVSESCRRQASRMGDFYVCQSRVWPLLLYSLRQNHLT